MGSWVEDFNSFQASSGGFDLTSGVPRKLHSKKEKLETELKLLQWHKLANEAAIKAALMQTKTIKETKNVKIPAHTTEDVKWMKKVIDYEKTRPLHVSKDFVLKYDQKEKERTEKLSEHVERHITTLRALRDKVETRKENNARTSAYRTWQKDFNPKKSAVLMGKTLDDFGSSGSSSRDKSRLRRHNNQTDDEIEKYQQYSQENKKYQNQELSNVLESLKKLSDLENRISSLEQDNVFDSLQSLNRVPDQLPALERTKLQFKKQVGQVNGPGGNMGVSYTLKTKKSSWNPKISKQPKYIIRNKININKSQKASTISGQGKGVFITEFDGIESNKKAQTLMNNQELLREELKRERRRQLELAPSGQKSLRNRIQERKTRKREEMLGAKRHDDAMQEIFRRRQEMQLRKPNLIKAYGSKSKGASSGVKTGNKYMKEFESVKQGLQKKTDAFKIAMEKDFQSKLSKDIQPSNSQPLLPPVGRRAPMTKSMGTSTRRTEDIPIRRRILGPDYDQTNSSIAVAGVSGLRLLRQSNFND